MKTTKQLAYKVEFPLCGHPELVPTMWGQEKPEPCQTIGACPVHGYTCPVCGFGVGCVPACGCPEMRYYPLSRKV